MRKTVLSLLALFLCVLTSCRMTETSGPVKESDSPASSGQNVVVIWDEKEETYQWICEIAKKIEITEIGIYEKEEYLSEVLLDAGLVIAGATGTKEDIVTLMNQASLIRVRITL